MQNRSLIRESRISSIKEKVFTLSAVREIAEVVWTEHEKFSKSGEDSKINFSVKCFDKSHYQSEEISIFDDRSVISKKRVESLSIVLNGDHSINLSLKHGNASENSFDVASNDSMWVNAITGKLNEIIDSVQDQESHLKNYYGLVVLVIFLLLTVTCSKLLDFSNRSTPNHTFLWKNAYIPEFKNWDIGLFILWVFFGGLLALGIGGRINDELDLLFPNIELQIGPEHKQMEKKRRAFYFLIITLIIIPLLLSLLLEAIF